MTDPVAPPGLPDAAEYLPCARDFGVRGDGSDESVAIRSAHDRVRETGGRFLWFPPGHYHAPSLVRAGDVIFVGEGRLTGAYRKSIVPPWAPAGGLVRSDIRPHRHLRRFAR